VTTAVEPWQGKFGVEVPWPSVAGLHDRATPTGRCRSQVAATAREPPPWSSRGWITHGQHHRARGFTPGRHLLPASGNGAGDSQATRTRISNLANDCCLGTPISTAAVSTCEHGK